MKSRCKSKRSEYLRFAYAMIAYEHEVVPRRGDVQQLPQFSDVRFDVCHFRIVLCREDRDLECRNVAVG